MYAGTVERLRARLRAPACVQPRAFTQPRVSRHLVEASGAFTPALIHHGFHYACLRVTERGRALLLVANN